MRGDNSAVGFTCFVVCGSPPHAWGQWRRRAPVLHRFRFTPTCVGTMASGRSPCPSRTVHPHMRGDNIFAGNKSSPTLGSPPHAWGQCRSDRLEVRRVRFTPTCVGTIVQRAPRMKHLAVHPHMRGDNVVHDVLSQIPTGSPPHAWGQCGQLDQIERRRRFTPTCVGTMPWWTARATPTSVHPHMRGDNALLLAMAMPQDGSPPHAWGQCRRSHPDRPGGRFTPTCVGTMKRVCTRGPDWPVHPHMRGDNVLAVAVTFSAGGSPPHAWGQWARRGAHAGLLRFTPTCVGTIPSPPRPCGGASVHPHMRGDNAEFVPEVSPRFGSPPHAWGQY